MSERPTIAAAAVASAAAAMSVSDSDLQSPCHMRSFKKKKQNQNTPLTLQREHQQGRHLVESVNIFTYSPPAAPEKNKQTTNNCHDGAETTGHKPWEGERRKGWLRSAATFYPG